MKKFLFALLFLSTACCLNLKAQTIEEEIYLFYLKNEIYMQYGTPSIVQMTNKLGNNTYTNPQTTKRYKSAGATYSGNAAIGYNRYLNPYFCIGGWLGYGESKIKAKDTETGKIAFTNNVRCITGLANFEWTYFRSGIWEISCGAAGGLVHKNEQITIADKQNGYIPQEKDRIAFAYNLSIARVRIGGGILAAFVDFGFGYKGLANGGISVKF